jgi:hypothetical protein
MVDHDGIESLAKNIECTVLVDARYVAGGSISVQRPSHVAANTSIAWPGAGRGNRGSIRTWERPMAWLHLENGYGHGR